MVLDKNYLLKSIFLCFLNLKRLFIMNRFIIMSIALANNVYAQRITEAYQDYDMEDGGEGSFGSWVFAIIFCISIGAILNNDSKNHDRSTSSTKSNG